MQCTCDPKSWQADVFPVCPLNGWRIVGALPSNCPLRCPAPLDEIRRLQDQGFEQLASGDPGGGLATLEKAKVCGACNLLTHPHVQALRAAAVARAGQDWR